MERAVRQVLSPKTWLASARAQEYAGAELFQFCVASAIGLATLVITRWSGRFGGVGLYLLTKEGPLEMLTFVLELLAAGFLAVAVFKKRTQLRTTTQRFVWCCYALCAALLFIVGMEEISWGQTFFHFQTPESWAAVNHQHETTLHNLVSREALTSSARYIAAAFGAGALLLTWLAYRPWGGWLRAIAPSPSLLPLAMCATVGGVFIHAEVVEFLVAVFFAFYAHNVLYLNRHRYVQGTHVQS